jgi:hypothetical protein
MDRLDEWMASRPPDARMTTSRFAWTVVGVVGVVLGLCLIGWLIWYWFRPARPSSSVSAKEPPEEEWDEAQDGEDHDPRDRCKPENTDTGWLVVHQDAAVLGQLHVRRVTGHGAPVHFDSRCQFQRGLEIGCHTITRSHFQINVPGIFTCRNNSGATVKLGKASEFHGAFILIHNDTGQPSVTVQCAFPTNHIQQVGTQTWQVAGSTWFISNGHETWMAWNSS